MMNIPIFLSSDNNYAPFVATAIASICDNTKSFIDFYILDGGISEENKELIKKTRKQFTNANLEFLNIDIEKMFGKFPVGQYFSASMYSRFLIPELKPDIDKAIYSDVDVVVLGDIADLYSEELNGYSVGAVQDMNGVNSVIAKLVRAKNKKITGVSASGKTFYSGMLLVDCVKWRAENITRKLLDLTAECTDRLRAPDQDVLNKYFGNNYTELDVKYQTGNVNACDFPVIYHFNGPVKPWHSRYSSKGKLHRYFNEFWYYAKMTPFYEKLKAQFDSDYAKYEETFAIT